VAEARCRFCKSPITPGAEKCAVCGSDLGSNGRQRWAHLVEDYVLNHFISTALPPDQALKAALDFARKEDPSVVKEIANKGGSQSDVVLAFLRKHFPALHAEWVRFKLAEPQLAIAFGYPLFQKCALQLREVVEPAAH
jgi:hypothetical protein